MQRGKLEGEHIVPVGESDLRRLEERTLQRGFRIGPAQGHRCVEQLKVSEHYRWHEGVGLDLIREKGVESVGTAEEHLAPRAAKRGFVGKDGTLETVFDAKVAKGTGPRIELTQAAAGGKPQVAGVIFEDAEDLCAGEPVGLPVVKKPLACRI